MHCDSLLSQFRVNKARLSISLSTEHSDILKCCINSTSDTHLYYMQLWQKVTVGQRHLVAIQEVAVGHLDVLDAVVVDLIGERRAQVFVQLLQRLHEPTLQSCADNRNLGLLY